jgi:Na+/phosphate symporter
MQTLLNLLAGVSLLVWGTHIVRVDILRLFGGSLGQFLGRRGARTPSRRRCPRPSSR